MSERWSEQLAKLREHWRELRRKESEKEMPIKVSGKDYQGGNGDFIKVDPGTYPCKLVGAKMYLNENFDKDKEVVQIGLIWDTGLLGERDDGSEVDLVIYDDWITFSLNEKAKMTARFKALLDFDETTVDLSINFQNASISGFGELKHWRDSKEPIESILLNFEDLFGKEALVTVTHNTAGYVKVTNVSKPLAATTSSKVRQRPAGAPA